MNRAAEEMRELENAPARQGTGRNLAQRAGRRLRAVMVFLQISQRRAKLNGLDSPAPVVVSPNVRMEMERALADLQQVLMAGEAELVGDDESD